MGDDRQRERALEQLAIAAMARASASHLFPHVDREDAARKFGELRERLRQRKIGE